MIFTLGLILLAAGFALGPMLRKPSALLGLMIIIAGAMSAGSLAWYGLNNFP